MPMLIMWLFYYFCYFNFKKPSNTKILNTFYTHVHVKYPTDSCTAVHCAHNGNVDSLLAKKSFLWKTPLWYKSRKNGCYVFNLFK